MLSKLEEYFKHTALNLGQALQGLRYLHSHPDEDRAGTARHFVRSLERRTKLVLNDLYFAAIPPHWHHTPEELKAFHGIPATRWFQYGYCAWRFDESGNYKPLTGREDRRWDPRCKEAPTIEFDPKNPIVKICFDGMVCEAKGDAEAAGKLFERAWHEAKHDFEKFFAAHFLAGRQKNAADKLEWLERALGFALKVGHDWVRSGLPALYTGIAKCHEELAATPDDKGPFYHGTRAELKIGDLLVPGGASNYQDDLRMKHIYFTGLMNGAGFAAALAKGDRVERVYVVEPTGPFEHDPNVTNKKLPGNPTRSYRSAAPLKIVGEIKEWAKLSDEERRKWREKIAAGMGEIID